MIKSEITLEDIIMGVVYSRFDNRGPEPISYYPKLEYTQLQRISLKSIALLAGSEGLVSKNVAVIPFPKMKMSAVIYFFEIPVEGARGNNLDATVSVLINQKYLSVFYKNMELFEQITRASIDQIIENYPDYSSNIVKNINNNLYELINKLYEQEKLKTSARIEKKPMYNYKISVIGDPGVGKTTLLLKYVDQAFRKLYIPTIGVQVSSKNVELVTNEVTKLTIWDIAGQKMFGNIRKRFYMGSMGVILIYDTTRKDTFNHIVNWWNDINSAFKIKTGILVANKSDLKTQVDKNDAVQLAMDLGLTYLETSAKTGKNVDKLFGEIAQQIHDVFKKS